MFENLNCTTGSAERVGERGEYLFFYMPTP